MLNSTQYNELLIYYEKKTTYSIKFLLRYIQMLFKLLLLGVTYVADKSGVWSNNVTIAN